MRTAIDCTMAGEIGRAGRAGQNENENENENEKH